MILIYCVLFSLGVVCVSHVCTSCVHQCLSICYCSFLLLFTSAPGPHFLGFHMCSSGLSVFHRHVLVLFIVFVFFQFSTVGTFNIAPQTSPLLLLCCSCVSTVFLCFSLALLYFCCVSLVSHLLLLCFSSASRVSLLRLLCFSCVFRVSSASPQFLVCLFCFSSASLVCCLLSFLLHLSLSCVCPAFSCASPLLLLCFSRSTKEITFVYMFPVCHRGGRFSSYCIVVYSRFLWLPFVPFCCY